MKEKKLTLEELRESVLKIMSYENDYMINVIVKNLSMGNSVLIDAVSYLGNGQYTKRNKKDRFKYKLITPIVDNNNLLYSTDLFKNAESAIKGNYGTYCFTRQLAVDVIIGIPCEYSMERFGHGYKKGKYGIYTIKIK